jgi:tRNA(Arg) A34 adenosine deaminase TadA
MRQARNRVLGSVRLALPPWTRRLVNGLARLGTDEDKMRLAIALARANVAEGTGGPFGAAVFQQPGHHLAAVGVNSVERLNNSVCHAEVMAIMLAEARLRRYTLQAPGVTWHELFTSCEPCAMCLGAILWSGVRRVVCGAGRRDAMALGFEEGPVFPRSYRYLADRGVKVVRGVLAHEARAVFDLYESRRGLVYNG